MLYTQERIEEVCHQSICSKWECRNRQTPSGTETSKANGCIWALVGRDFVPLSLLFFIFREIIKYPREQAFGGLIFPGV